MNMSPASSNPSSSVGVVGGSPGLRRGSAMVANDEVDDGDSPGTGSSSWGGSNRWIPSSLAAAGSDEIPKMRCSPCSCHLAFECFWMITKWAYKGCKDPYMFLLSSES